MRLGRMSLFVFWVLLAAEAGGQDSDELRVRVEVSPGTHYAGQAIELRVGVVGAGQRPEVDRPSIVGADVWLIDNNGLKPLSLSSIGGMAAESNLFVSRFCVVPRRSGTLVIPAIRAHLRDWSGGSRPVKLTIRPVPVEGRPAEFLGGVGRFSLEAVAEPKVLRVGQELEFRMTVKGSAAWGMSDRPELKRFDRLPIGLRIEPKPTEMTANPPLRQFVYRLRPTRPGEAVLPPVAIASFDPASARYITQISPGVPVQVVAVPSFDPAGFDPGESLRGSGPSTARVWIASIVSAVLLLGVTVGLVRVRRRTKDRRLHGPAAASRYAARLARGPQWSVVGYDKQLAARCAAARRAGGLGSVPVETGGDDLMPLGVLLALEVSSAFVRYLEIGLGRPPGALTPQEAAGASRVVRGPTSSVFGRPNLLCGAMGCSIAMRPPRPRTTRGDCDTTPERCSRILAAFERPGPDSGPIGPQAQRGGAPTTGLVGARHGSTISRLSALPRTVPGSPRN